MRTERSSGPGTDQATAPAPSRHALFRAAVRDPGILALVLGYAVIVVILTATPHGSWKPTLFWAVQIPSDALFFYASRYIARHGCRDDKARRFWRLTAFAAGAFVTGDILRTVEGVLGIEHNDAGPVQTICFVVGQTAFIIALVGYPVAGTGSARHRFLLDGAIVVCGAGSVVWYLLADTPGGESGDVFNGLIVGAQVLMVGFLSVKLVLSGYSPVIRPAAASMIAAGLVTAVVTAILPLYADRITLGESLAIQLLPTLLIAAGPRLQVIHLVIDLTDEPTKRRRPYSLLPYGAVALVHGLTLYEVNTHRVIHLRGVGLLGAVAITTLLVVWRQLLSVGENAQLIRELDRSLLELAHEKDRFSSLVAHSSDITLVVTRDQRITYASPAAERILGLRPEQLVGNQLADFVHPADFERIAPEMEALLSVPCRVVTVQARLRTMGGRWRWLEAVNTNLLDDPSVNGIVCNCRCDTRSHLTSELADRRPTMSVV